MNEQVCSLVQRHCSAIVRHCGVALRIDSVAEFIFTAVEKPNWWGERPREPVFADGHHLRTATIFNLRLVRSLAPPKNSLLLRQKKLAQPMLYIFQNPEPVLQAVLRF
jgi:hypothetical protein